MSLFWDKQLLYFIIFMALIYLYNYLGQGQVILSITNSRKNNDEHKKLKICLKRLSNLLNLNQTFLFTIFLGEVHTYGDLKADSDSLATKIDSLDIPEKSPVVVYGGQGVRDVGNLCCSN